MQPSEQAGNTTRRCAGIVVGLAILLAGCGESSPLFQGGPGAAESKPFELKGGSYLLGWRISAQTSDGCQIAVELVTAADRSPVGRGDADYETGGAAQGSEPVGDVEAGSYRLQVDSTCESWTAVVGEAGALRR
jgi:hypothetical protein